MSDQMPISIYTEMTPNPESLKFVVNKMLLPSGVAEFKDEASAKPSPLATELFGFPYVRGVFIAQNFITVSKEQTAEWHEIIPTLKEFIKDFVASGKEVLDINAISTAEPAPSATGQADGAEGDASEELIAKIKEMLKTYVQPAVEMDGGHIEYRSFKDGVVTLALQGACSGCPSSTLTLKAGIEGLLKRMVPEVQEVVAEAE